MFYDRNLFLILLFLTSIWKTSYLETNFTAIMYGIKDNWIFVKPQNCNVDIFLISDEWNKALITLYKLIGNHDNTDFQWNHNELCEINSFRSSCNYVSSSVSHVKMS